MTVLNPKRIKDILHPGKVPDIAWPTLLLVLTCLSVLTWVILGLYRNQLSPIVAMLVMTCCNFAIFTPMHDAAHGSIFSVNSGLRPLNDWVGIVCGFSFPLPFYAFKYLHLQHHKHTK
jgi:beta-carotene hydroxylase